MLRLFVIFQSIDCCSVLKGLENFIASHEDEHKTYDYMTVDPQKKIKKKIGQLPLIWLQGLKSIVNILHQMKVLAQ